MMEGAFFFLFGTLVGMAALPHIKRMVEQARRRLAELDQQRDPRSRL
jgi:hypothetical protein